MSLQSLEGGFQLGLAVTRLALSKLSDISYSFSKAQLKIGETRFKSKVLLLLSSALTFLKTASASITVCLS